MTIITWSEFLIDRSKAEKPPSTGSRKTHKRREQRKRSDKRKKDKMNTATVLPAWPINYSLGCMTTPVPHVPVATAQKKGKPMCYDCDCNDESTVENRKLTYVQNRVTSVEYSKRTDLRKMFKLDDDASPSTTKELLDRIEKKQYQIKTDEEQKLSSYYYGYGALSGFRWRAEDSKPDQAGHDAAGEELNKFARSVELKATVGSADQQIEAIQSLVDWQPSNKPA